MARTATAVLALAAAVTVGGCGSRSVHTGAAMPSDPPLLVPWSRIGDIALGEPRTRVERGYGSAGHGYHVLQRYGDTVQGYYRLHGSKVIVTFYGSRVGELDFATPYYRTKGGFGVGSTIPLGPCHRTAANRCEHRWHGFIYNPSLRKDPCRCWVKVGLGARSLRPVNATNFAKPWFFIYLRRGHVARFYFALRYVD
jgi:hypothetical protein